MDYKIVEENSIKLDKKIEKEKKIYFKGKILNEIIILFIENNIVKKNSIYLYSKCREFNINNTYILCCSVSNIKFINESIINNNNIIYEKMDIYKYFQSENKNLNSILNRDLNFKQDNIRRYNNLKKIISNKTYLDFACGYGGMLFKCKDICKNIMGVEIMESCISILKNEYNFNIYNNIDNIKDNSIDVISIFQSFELLENPLLYLKKFYNKLKKGGKLIIETSNSNKILHSIYKNYGYQNFTTSLRKIIYTEDSIKFLLEYSNFKNISIKYEQRYNLSNHLGWLVYNNSGNNIDLFNDKELNNSYYKILIDNKIADTLFIICNK